MLNIKGNLKLFFGTGLFYAVLMALAFFAINSGKKMAVSEAVLKIAVQAEAGLNYFFQDNLRYPTAFEFSDKTIMPQYFTHFPFQNFVGGNCVASIDYQLVEKKFYKLGFCLLSKSGNYGKGWNYIKN